MNMNINATSYPINKSQITSTLLASKDVCLDFCVMSVLIISFHSVGCSFYIFYILFASVVVLCLSARGGSAFLGVRSTLCIFYVRQLC